MLKKTIYREHGEPSAKQQSLKISSQSDKSIRQFFKSLKDCPIFKR